MPNLALSFLAAEPQVSGRRPGSLEGACRCRRRSALPGALPGQALAFTWCSLDRHRAARRDRRIVPARLCVGASTTDRPGLDDRNSGE